MSSTLEKSDVRFGVWRCWTYCGRCCGRTHISPLGVRAAGPTSRWPPGGHWEAFRRITTPQRPAMQQEYRILTVIYLKKNGHKCPFQRSWGDRLLSHKCNILGGLNPPGAQRRAGPALRPSVDDAQQIV